MSGGDPLGLTLEDPEDTGEFREFLRTRLDLNKSEDPDFKKKFETWLDFVLLCQQILSLAEDETDERVDLMLELGERFLAKPPLGYNIALKDQLNRTELVLHCKNLRDRVTPDADVELVRPGYEYIWSNLSKKHDIFRRTRPKTALHALMCALS